MSFLLLSPGKFLEPPLISPPEDEGKANVSRPQGHSNSTVTLRCGAHGELEQVGISFPCLLSLSCFLGQGFWRKEHWLSWGGGTRVPLQKVNQGLYFVLPLTCAQVEEPVLGELWLLLSLCDPCRDTASVTCGTGVLGEATTSRTDPPGNISPLKHWRARRCIWYQVHADPRGEEKVDQWWAGLLRRQMAMFLTEGRVGAFYIFTVSDQFLSRLHKLQILRGVTKRS